MAFTQETFATVGAQAADTPTVYSYKTLDSLPVVTSIGYFAEKRLQIEEGDIIQADLNGIFHILIVESDRQTATEQPLEQAVTDLVNNLITEVQKLSTSDVQVKMFSILCVISDKLSLLNTRIEEAFDTGLTMEDVE